MAFFLQSDKAETTTTTQDELELLQAGLGKRTLSITKDISHEEVLLLCKYLAKCTLYLALMLLCLTVTLTSHQLVK